MKAHLIIDLVLIAIALVIVVRCWQQGLVASLIRLAGTVVSYVSAWLLSKPISLQLYDSFINDRLLDYAGSILPPELRELPPELLDSASRFPEVKEQLSAAVNTAFTEAGFDINLPVKLVDTEGVGNRLVDSILEGGSTVAEALVEVIMKPAALTLTRVLVFILIFTIVSAVVSILFRMGKVVNHIPLLGGLNRLAGMGVGLVEAAICLYIITALIFMAATLLRAADIGFLQGDVLAQSSVLHWVAGWKLPQGFVLLPS